MHHIPRIAKSVAKRTRFKDIPDDFPGRIALVWVHEREHFLNNQKDIQNNTEDESLAVYAHSTASIDDISFLKLNFQ